jgi:deoxycytidine triphosphate deaminase
MLIVGDEILGLLNDADERHIKNASYYLTIGTIIPVGGKVENLDFNKPSPPLVLKPRQVAWVVSREVFNIKSHEITALVTLRSTFTKQGLLALDVGLVDPGFEGPIGSIVINFSKNDILLTAGEEFFRVIFIRHPEVPDKFRTQRIQETASEYATQRYKDVVQGFPDTFLNTELLSDEMADKVSERVANDVLNRMILFLFKKYWGRTLIGILVFGAAIAAVVYVLFTNFGPKLSEQDIQKRVQTYIDQRFPKDLPQRP